MQKMLQVIERRLNCGELCAIPQRRCERRSFRLDAFTQLDDLENGCDGPGDRRIETQCRGPRPGVRDETHVLLYDKLPQLSGILGESSGA